MNHSEVRNHSKTAQAMNLMNGGRRILRHQVAIFAAAK